MEYETPRELLTRLKTSREESIQRLLTTLILDAPYPKWNTRSMASLAGVEFLRKLHALSFDSGWGGDVLEFVDEFELRGRSDDERGGAPDYAVVWRDRLWMIELKTEAASHRRGQLPLYLELGRHYFPDSQIDLTYLTPPLSKPAPKCEPWARFAHVTWQEVQPLLRSAWPSPASESQRAVVNGLCAAIDLLNISPAEWRANVLQEQHAPLTASVDSASAAVTAVKQTASDRQQRAIDLPGLDLDDLLGLRVEMRDQVAAEEPQSPLRHVRPWLWNSATRGGTALSPSGAEVGYELRCSWYSSPVPPRAE